MKATAVLPVKRFAAAKQRLAAELDEARRHALVAAMTADVVEAIGKARLISDAIMVSDEPLAREIAAGAGVELVPEPPDGGHIGAVLAGISRAEAAGAGCVVVIPGDCPLLDPREFDRLLAGISAPCVAVVPDRHGLGTNALVLCPPDAILPCFGECSRSRHVDAARRAGVPCRVAALPSVGLDLDTPGDLATFTAVLRSGRGRALRTARAIGF